MFRRNVVDEIIKFQEYFWFAKGIFNYIGFETYYIEYNVKERINGKSKYSIKSLMRCGIEGITNFTELNVKMIKNIGLIMFIISIIYISIFIKRQIFNNIIINSQNIIIFLILFVGGINIILLSTISSSIYRVYIESKQRPTYIVKEKMEAKCNKN